MPNVRGLTAASSRGRAQALGFARLRQAPTLLRRRERILTMPSGMGFVILAGRAGRRAVGGGGGSYDVDARIAAFIARHKAFRVARGQSNTSTFEGAVTLPTAPTITDPGYTANSQATFNSARGNGREITITGSFTGVLGVSGYTDMRIIIPSGVQVTAPANTEAIALGTASRIHFLGTGGNVEGGMTGNGFSDVHFERMNIATRLNSSFDWQDSITLLNFSRLLIESTSIYARSYALYYENCSQVVCANSEFITASPAPTTHATCRGINCNVSLWLDCRVVNQGGQQCLRWHENSTKAGVMNTQVENGALSVQMAGGWTTTNVQDIVLLDNNLYGTAIFIPENNGGFPNVTMATVDGNTGYTNLEGGSQLALGGDIGASWLIGNNPRVADQSPPAWSRQ